MELGRIVSILNCARQRMSSSKIEGSSLGRWGGVSPGGNTLGKLEG